MIRALLALVLLGCDVNAPIITPYRPCAGACQADETCVARACVPICANQFHCWSGCCLPADDAGINACRPAQACFGVDAGTPDTVR